MKTSGALRVRLWPPFCAYGRALLGGHWKTGGVSRRLPPLDALDRAEHRFLLAGFPLLTIGIITGPVWAKRVEAGATSDILRAVFGCVPWLASAGGVFLRAAAGRSGRGAWVESTAVSRALS